jgi:hypothetical protein
MGHKINFTMEVNDKYYDSIKENLPRALYDEIETRRELTIMHEVMSAKGYDIDEKIYNTLKSWENECDYDRYKFKYRH